MMEFFLLVIDCIWNCCPCETPDVDPSVAPDQINPPAQVEIDHAIEGEDQVLDDEQNHEHNPQDNLNEDIREILDALNLPAHEFMNDQLEVLDLDDQSNDSSVDEMF